MANGKDERIELRGVRTHNLKDMDVDLPLGKITVVTGVSGSGKSSLVFDTLYGESYRRYVESLSSFARQYLKSLPKPALTSVANLPPAIAVRQARSGATSRSTVGTATEVDDLLRVLFAAAGGIVCHKCGQKVERDTPDGAAAQVLAAWSGERALITAPMAAWGKIAAKELKAQLTAQGFTRLLVAGKVERLEDVKAKDLREASAVVDRVRVGEEGASRLREALTLALRLGRGHAAVVRDGADAAKVEPLLFSTGLDCPRCHIEYVEPSESLLSHNHPAGACPRCQGFGFVASLDWDKVIPDLDATLTEDGVAAWNFGKFREYYAWAKTSAKRRGIRFEQPFSAYSAAEMEWLKHGDGAAFDGIQGFFDYLDSKKYKAHYRIHAARFREYVTCEVCGGRRLNPAALAVKLGGISIADAEGYSVEGLATWLRDVAIAIGPRDVEAEAAKGSLGITEALLEAQARLGYLQRIGVSYLTLTRATRTLSGGELQRINMARCLGSALTDTLFCLDEPSSGLHARDSGQLLAIMRELRDQGNTVVVVEHERRLIAGADHLVEIGPKAGHDGGRLVYEGAPRPQRLSPTLAPRSAKIDPDAGGASFLVLSGVRTNNLKDVTVKMPTGAFTAVCGVSGSGKTSLIQHTLYPLMARALSQPADKSANVEPIAKGLGPAAAVKRHDEIMMVGQSALSRSSRSNIATYLGLMDDIRKLFAATPEAKKLGMTPGTFSFNTPGGRCETCRGLGTVVEDLSFLGEMEITCPDCQGQRFVGAVMTVPLLGKNLAEVLALTVDEARAFFFGQPALTAICDSVIQLGLGYVTLGQHTSSFSGGEAQRLKLLGLLSTVRKGRPKVLVFDEPTSGLADADVANLINQFRALVERGHTVIVVEHHLDVLRAADWLVEIGPEAASRGGEVVYAGPPAGLAGLARSVTAPYLFEAARGDGALVKGRA